MTWDEVVPFILHHLFAINNVYVNLTHNAILNTMHYGYSFFKWYHTSVMYLKCNVKHDALWVHTTALQLSNCEVYPRCNAQQSALWLHVVWAVKYQQSIMGDNKCIMEKWWSNTLASSIQETLTVRFNSHLYIQTITWVWKGLSFINKRFGQ